MIEIVLKEPDLSKVRFAWSPLWEALASVRVLEDPRPGVLFRQWASEVKSGLAGEDLALMEALVPPTSRYIPDFVAPPPDPDDADLEAELERLRQAHPESIRTEAQKIARLSGGATSGLRRFIARPADALQELADLVERYWAEALADHWSSVQRVLEADVLTRGWTLARHGPSGVFNDLHPNTAWDGRILSVGTRYSTTIQAGGKGLVLVPAIFSAPDLHVIMHPGSAPSVVYPARRGGMAFHDHDQLQHPLAEGILGVTRARILVAAADPVTTSGLAARLDLTPGAVSQHLTSLHDSGLLMKSRLGRSVYYRLSEKGRHLMQLLESHDGPGIDQDPRDLE